MPGENLTRIEATERAALVTVASYNVVLDLTTGPTTFGSTTTVRFAATPGAATFIDAITAQVHAVTLNGAALDPAVVSDGIRIQLDGLQAENELVVIADALYTNTGEGLHRFVDPVDNEVYLYSQFEVPDSRRVFAVFEQPNLKAKFSFTVTAPSEWQVVSNSTTPEPTDAGNGASTWAFEPTHTISSYITALIAGPYAVVRSELTSSDGRIIPLGVFSRRSLSEYLDADYILEKTRQGFAYYEEKFGYAYPFDKYDQLFVPEFNAGAMENAGAVTFTETYIFRSKVTDAVKERRVVTILHELAHMWFGDLVTMTWWNDLWLNESFAEWASTIATAEATEWHEAWTTFAVMEKSWAYKQDQLPSTHPVVATIRDLDDVLVNFDGITYAKGGSVLKQLAAWVGIEAFFTGVGSYFQKHQWGNTELSDLLVELEAASGRDLSQWAALWLETAGVNTLRPEIATDETGVITGFTVVQSAAADYPTIRPHRLAIGFYTFSDAHKLVRTHRVELDVDGSTTHVPALVGLKRPDLILLNDDDLTYAKVRLDPASEACALEHLAAIESPLARALVWGSVWDATRDAETTARDFVRLVLNNVATETESTTLRTVLGQVVLTANYYVAEPHRTIVTTEVAEALWTLAQGAAAGSDAQFQFVKFFAAVAATPAQLENVAALRSGDTVLDGLAVDTDLAWELVTALVAGGRVDATEIDAALARDNTATGAQSAALARAALPTAEGKLAAWSSLIDVDTAATTIVRTTAAGFLRVNDEALLEPFVATYFDMLQAVWESRSFSIGEKLVIGLYPAPLNNRALADATQDWLDANPEPAALRRLVVENLAGVERSLRVQARDAE